MSKARDVADLFSDGAILGDAAIDVTELTNSSTGNLASGPLNVSGNVTATGNVQISPTSGTSLDITSGGGILFSGTSTASILGQSTMTIDPSPHGASGGTVNVNGSLVVEGDLTVNGTNTTINSTTKTIADLDLILASGASFPSDAVGAGITIDGADVDFHWNGTKMVLLRTNQTLGVSLELANTTTRQTTGGANAGSLKAAHLMAADGYYIVEDEANTANGTTQKRCYYGPYYGGDTEFKAYDSTTSAYYRFLHIRGNGTNGTNTAGYDAPTVEFRTVSPGADNDDGGTATGNTNGAGTPVIVYSHKDVSDTGGYSRGPLFEVLAPTIRSNHRLVYGTNTYGNPGPLLHGVPQERIQYATLSGTTQTVAIDDYNIFDFSGANLSANIEIRVITNHHGQGDYNVNGIRGYTDGRLAGIGGTPERAVTFAVIVKNGSTPYAITGFKLGNTTPFDLTSNLLWQGGSAPTGNANSHDLYTFTIMADNPNTNAYSGLRVFGSLAQFGT